MNPLPASSYSSLIYYRLIALWVLVEALLGGIIHGLKIPVSGLIVGGCAVICISLIGWYRPAKGAVLRATVVVAIFKMMLSPHTPPPAYIAVFFQGLMGELLFRKQRFYRVACFALAVLTLLESALQRILVLVIVYGNGLWQAVNDFINGLTKQSVPADYSRLIAGGYVMVHVLAGVLIGWWAAVLPSRLRQWSSEETNRLAIREGTVPAGTVPSRRRRWLKKGLLIVWIVLVLLYVQSVTGIGAPLLPASKVVQLLIRSLLIVLSWYFLLGPLLRRWLHRWLQRQQQRHAADIRQVVELLPATQALVRQAWRQSAGHKGWKRMMMCMKLVLVNALYPAMRPVTILTGPVHTGKTTALLQWSQGRGDVQGILTPILEGRRVFLDVHTGNNFGMEAAAGETATLNIGRYVFSQSAFEKASQLIRDAKQPGWLVIDEVGPLELQGQGFAAVLKEVLQQPVPGQHLLLVVREGLVEKVKEAFELQGIIIIRDVTELV